jgi:autotransporter-associated beta strand protein
LKNALVNNSANEQTFTLPIVLGGDLNVGANTQNIVLADSVSGTGSLYITGWGILSMQGNNTYSGNTTIGGASGGWPPTNGIAVAGNGTPAAGPLGTGKIIMYGGSLTSYGDATLYNDIEMNASKWSYFYQSGGALILKGRLTGSGTIVEDCNTYAGLHLQGDNSGFTGDFRTQNRSGYHRVFFENPDCGSARASWFLQANNAYGHILNFQSGTLHFGSLAGGGYIRSYQGKPVISIGALNWSSTYSGTMRDFITIEKVGTGTLIFSGNNVYTGTTTILEGTFLLNNNPTLGSFTSPVIAVGGAFGGTGRSTASVTINTGATLEPGNLGVGTLTTDTLTMNADATYKVEIDTSSDKMVTPGVVLNNAVLDITVTKAAALQEGSAFTIVDNTGTAAVQGTFKGLPESGSILAGGINFRITYKGGTGNDIVLTVGDTTGKLVQTISFTTADTLQTGDADLTLNAVASSGLPVSFTSSNEAVATIIEGHVHVIRAGTTVITASQAGDDLYDPVLVKHIIIVVTGNNNPKAQISIFPNPATEKLTVQLGEVAPEAVMYVYNNQGALVYTSRLTDTVNTVDVQHWAPGLYYIKISNGNNYTEKIIKQ